MPGQNVETNKLFCIISMWAGRPSVIECADKKLWQRRGVNEAPFRLSYPCFNVSANAYKKLLAEGFVELSQEEYLDTMIERGELNAYGNVPKIRIKENLSC